MPEAARYRYELSKVRHRDRCFLGEHGAAMSEAAVLSLSYMFSGLLLGFPHEEGATTSVPSVLHTVHACHQKPTEKVKQNSCCKQCKRGVWLLL